MLRSDSGVIKTGRNRMSAQNLSVLVLHEVAVRAVENPRRPGGKGGGVLTRGESQTASFHSIKPNSGVLEKSIKEADGVRAPADTGDSNVRQAVVALQILGSCLITDDPVKLADHVGIRVRARGGSDDVM